MIYAIPNKLYSLEEYLELDYLTDAKYEYFDDGKLVEISGVNIKHAEIEGNVLSIFYEKLSENYQEWIGSMKLKVPALPPYRYPNFSISPKERKIEMVGKHHCLVNPIVIGEIYSPETKDYDWGKKFEAYKSIESFQEYVLIDQEQELVTVFTNYDEGVWFPNESTAGETLKLESLDIELSVDEIYAGIIE
jgi:Uma2 family endonuclease